MKKLKVIGIGVLSTFLTLNGCGGGGSPTVASTSSGIGGTGVASSGTITGFGSIFVNGVEYFTDQANVEFNDQQGVASQLKLGMKVNLQANVVNNVAHATSVVFDFEAQGPVSGLTVSPDGLTKTFSVLGTTMKVNKTTTVFDNSKTFKFANLVNNQLVSVSGLFDANSVLIVDFIETAGDFSVGSSVVEIKGLVTGLMSNNDFMLGNIKVIGGSVPTLEKLPNGLSNNLFVEVKGKMSDSTTLIATKIQGEQQGFSGFVGGVKFEGKAELEGYVTDFISNASFKVNGQLVDATNATFKPSGSSVINGTKIEVNGNVMNGILQATKVHVENEDIKLYGQVSALPTLTSGKKLTLSIGTSTIDVTFDTSTLFNDGQGNVDNMTIDNLVVGDYVEIKASKISGVIVASTVKRDDVDDQVIKGPLDSNGITTSTITILGVTMNLDSSTKYQDNTLSQSAFINLINSSATVKVIEVKDKLVNGVVDGIADEVSFD